MSISEKNTIIRCCLLFEFKLGAKATDAAAKICSAFGEDYVSVRTAQEWFKKFRDGRTSLTDKPRSGRPSSLDNEALRAAIESDPDQTLAELAEQFSVSSETIRTHLKDLGKSWRLNKWVPHELTEDQKTVRKTICSSLHFRSKIDPFYKRILTCDEKWVMFDNTTRKHSWLDAGSSASTPRPSIHQRKVHLCVWWTYIGIVHYELLPVGHSITGQVYADQLDRVNEALAQKQPALVNRKGVCLLHDNARPHVAKISREKIIQLGWEVLPHPPYSPDLAPSDYHLFRSLDNYIRDKKFRSTSDVESALNEFFSSKDQSFYQRGINMLAHRWQTVIDNNGEYFED